MELILEWHHKSANFNGNIKKAAVMLKKFAILPIATAKIQQKPQLPPIIHEQPFQMIPHLHNNPIMKIISKRIIRLSNIFSIDAIGR